MIGPLLLFIIGVTIRAVRTRVRLRHDLYILILLHIHLVREWWCPTRHERRCVQRSLCLPTIRKTSAWSLWKNKWVLESAHLTSNILMHQSRNFFESGCSSTFSSKVTAVSWSLQLKSIEISKIRSRAVMKSWASDGRQLGYQDQDVPIWLIKSLLTDMFLRNPQPKPIQINLINLGATLNRNAITTSSWEHDDFFWISSMVSIS